MRFHRTVHRPWGTYTVLEEGDRFKIKRIEVKPNGRVLNQPNQSFIVETCCFAPIDFPAISGRL